MVRALLFSALRRARDEPRDVHELDHRGDHLLRPGDGRERPEARIGHLDDADVRLDGAERVVLGRDAGLGQGVEESGLADVRQAHDAALEAHFLPNSAPSTDFFAAAAGSGSFFGFSSVCAVMSTRPLPMLRGRAASWNPANRFERLHVDRDGWLVVASNQGQVSPKEHRGRVAEGLLNHGAGPRTAPA